MTSASTFLWFPDRAEEAVDFYVSLLPGSSKDRTQTLTDPRGRELTITEFTLAGAPFQAMGGAEDSGPFTTAVSISVSVDDQAELDRVWEAILSTGGTEMACGWITDQYGVSWQIVPSRYYELCAESPETAQRVAEALWGMVKIDIAGLEAAAKSA